MKGWKQRPLAVVLAAALLLAGCSSGSATVTEKTEGLDALGKITVISREEGSGTRSAFAQMADFDDSTAEASDATTENAVIAESTDEVIAQVGSDASAIGYISMGAEDQLTQGKVLSVDGQEASREAVEKGDYSLSRAFYLAYSGELSELEQDFLTYVGGKGQEIVGQSYVTVAKSSTFLSNQAEGTIEIHGSTSAGPLLEELAAAYMEINTHARITVVRSDSTSGMTDAMQGACDFGMASRDLKDYEKELLDYTMIAKDGIEVIVNENNPLENISLADLKQIYTGAITEWEELNHES